MQINFAKIKSIQIEYTQNLTKNDILMHSQYVHHKKQVKRILKIRWIKNNAFFFVIFLSYTK